MKLSGRSGTYVCLSGMSFGILHYSIRSLHRAKVHSHTVSDFLIFTGERSTKNDFVKIHDSAIFVTITYTLKDLIGIPSYIIFSFMFCSISNLFYLQYIVYCSEGATLQVTFRCLVKWLRQNGYRTQMNHSNFSNICENRPL